MIIEPSTDAVAHLGQHLLERAVAGPLHEYDVYATLGRIADTVSDLDALIRTGNTSGEILSIRSALANALPWGLLPEKEDS